MTELHGKDARRSDGLGNTDVWNFPDSLLDSIPVGVYMCDSSGAIIRYNRAAQELWGRAPELAEQASRFCGSYRLRLPGGAEIPHSACGMAEVLASGHGLRDQRVLIERPDGTHVLVTANIEPTRNAEGKVTGAVNVFYEEARYPGADFIAQRLAAIVESSDDAILTKDLNGVITSWNQSAQRLFGYEAEEVIGKPVTILIPAERHDEEPAILARIRRGDRIEHYDTIRRHKDGTLLDISLTVSPLRDAEGRVIGASKIARDISDRKQAEEKQELLLREMDHRVRNLFTLASSVVAMSARSARTTEDLANDVSTRLSALARAHSLMRRRHDAQSTDVSGTTTLQGLIAAIVSPHAGLTDEGKSRISTRGADIGISESVVTSFALLFHEFATNAAKYGALSSAHGSVDILCSIDDHAILVTWTEAGGPPVTPTEATGFGSRLGRATIERQLGGSITRDWQPEGLVIRMTVPRARLELPAAKA